MVTQSAYAKLRGVSVKTVGGWKRRGLVVFSPEGGVDVARSDSLLNERPDVYRGGKKRAVTEQAPSAAMLLPGDISISEAIRRKEVAVKKKRELDLEVASGKLVNATDVEVIMRSDYATTAARLLGLPSKLAPRVAAMKTAQEVEAFLYKEFVKALNSLSKAASDQLKKVDS